MTDKECGSHAAWMIKKRMAEKVKVYVHVCLNGMREYGIPNSYDPNDQDVWEVEKYNERDVTKSTWIHYTDCSSKEIPLELSKRHEASGNFVPISEPDVNTKFEWKSISLDHKVAKDCFGEEKSVDDYTGQSVWIYIENTDGSFNAEKKKVAVFKLSPLVDTGEQVSGGANSVQLKFRVDDCAIDVSDPSFRREDPSTRHMEQGDLHTELTATSDHRTREQEQETLERIGRLQTAEQDSIINRTYRFSGKFEILEVRVSFALLVRLYASKELARIKEEHSNIQRTRKLYDREIRELAAIEALFEQTKKKPTEKKSLIS
jgi:hypothetical protein